MVMGFAGVRGAEEIQKHTTNLNPIQNDHSSSSKLNTRVTKWENSGLVGYIWDRIIAVIRFLTSFLAIRPLPSTLRLTRNSNIEILSKSRMRHIESVLKEIDPDFKMSYGLFSFATGLEPQVKIQAIDCLYNYFGQIDEKAQSHKNSSILCQFSIVDLPSKNTYEFSYVPGDDKKTIAKSIINALKQEYTGSSFKFALRLHCNVLTSFNMGMGPIILDRYFVPECHPDYQKSHREINDHPTSKTTIIFNNFWTTTTDYYPEFSQFGENGLVREHFYSYDNAMKSFHVFKNIMGGTIHD